ncbi:MAG: hypothetical protein A2V77_22600 [Anaeromyxobacter sp. RBG_16_69_14]|nr:MAG: hypothetical protein A2V77_22600 [Anaeromyxobacter sp. RBG_16_69_14]
MTPVRSPLLALLATMAVLGAVLAGCPQERPGVEKQNPPPRVPPAVTLEPPPTTDGGAPASVDGSVQPSR